NRIWAPQQRHHTMLVRLDSKLFNRRTAFASLSDNTERIFAFIVFRSPLIPLIVKNNRGVLFGRNGIQAIFSSSKRLSLNQHIFINLKGSRLICPGSPNLAKRDDIYANFTPLQRGLTIMNINGNTIGRSYGRL